MLTEALLSWMQTSLHPPLGSAREMGRSTGNATRKHKVPFIKNKKDLAALLQQNNSTELILSFSNNLSSSSLKYPWSSLLAFLHTGKGAGPESTELFS